MYVITRGARDLRELGRGAWVGVGDLQPAAVLFPGHPGCSPSALKLLHLAKKCYFGARLEEWADHMGGWVLGWLCCVARGSVVLMLIYIYIVYIYIYFFSSRAGQPVPNPPIASFTIRAARPTIFLSGRPKEVSSRCRVLRPEMGDRTFKLEAFWFYIGRVELD